MAKKKRKAEFAGLGCVIELIGLVLLFVFPIGTVIGIALLIFGSQKAIRLICSDCGNLVQKESIICPHCKERFGESKPSPTADKDRSSEPWQCPKCGATSSGGSYTCTTCGYSLV